MLTTLAIDSNELRKRLLDINCNPMMIPSVVHQVVAIPKLGSGKTDFSGAKTLALELGV
jgi:acyl-[acyl-carrier-protein]-phospholipid O-acyltransferase/long-chain-fatty-acid--[acyl-carrier-protein] ligase